jgi:hypothetical protein
MEHRFRRADVAAEEPWQPYQEGARGERARMIWLELERAVELADERAEPDDVADRLAVEPHGLALVAEEREVGVGGMVVEGDGALREVAPVGEAALALGAVVRLPAGLALDERLVRQAGGGGLRREGAAAFQAQRCQEGDAHDQPSTHSKGRSCERVTAESTRGGMALEPCRRADALAHW